MISTPASLKEYRIAKFPGRFWCSKFLWREVPPMENCSSLCDVFSAKGGESFHKIGISRFYEKYISLRPLRL